MVLASSGYRTSRTALALVLTLCFVYPAGATGSPRTFTAISFRTRLVGWAGGNGFILSTRDGGKRWTSQYEGSASILSFDFVDQRTGWAVAADRLLATRDGGRHWQVTFLRRRPLSSVDFLSRNEGWGVSRVREGFHAQDLPPLEGRLVRTNDGGHAWRAEVKPHRVQSVCFTNSREGWVGERNSVLRTADGGRTWNRAFAPVPGPQYWFATVHCTSNAVCVWFAGSGGAGNQLPYIAYLNTGRGWKALFDEGHFFQSYPKVRVPFGPGNYPGPFAVTASRTAYFLGRDFVRYGVGVLASIDSGRTWKRGLIRTLDPSEPLSVSFVDPSHGWIAGRAMSKNSNGRVGEIMRTTDGGRTWRREYVLH